MRPSMTKRWNFSKIHNCAPFLVPLLDGKMSTKQRARIAERLVREKVGNREQAVAKLVASDDPRLKSCGVYAIGTLQSNLWK